MPLDLICEKLVNVFHSACLYLSKRNAGAKEIIK